MTEEDLQDAIEGEEDDMEEEERSYYRHVGGERNHVTGY